MGQAKPVGKKDEKKKKGIVEMLKGPFGVIVFLVVVAIAVFAVKLLFDYWGTLDEM